MNATTTTLSRIRGFALASAHFLRLAALELFALWLIVGTGAAVRLTDSGLGCRHWPGCEKGHPLPAKDVHAYIEFGNRLVGGVTIALTLVGWLAARRTRGLPHWVVRLSLSVFVGALAQAPLGYLAVKSDLRWPVVMAHLLLSMLLLVQMTIGEIQWRTHLPWGVVLAHVLLAGTVWAGTVALATLFVRPLRSLAPNVGSLDG